MNKGRARVNQWLSDAYKSQARLFLGMTASERETARSRIIYIVSCRGVDGFIQLGAMHRESWANEIRPVVPVDGLPSGTDGRTNTVNENLKRLRWSPVEILVSKSAVSTVKEKIALESGSVFSHDHLLAMMYFFIAKNRGSNLAPIFLEEARKEFESINGESAKEDVEKLMQQVESDARRWVPPYEFYPRGVGMYPHSDECVLSAAEERQLKTVSRYVASDEIMQALWFLQFLHGGRDQWGGELVRAIGDFQESFRVSWD